MSTESLQAKCEKLGIKYVFLFYSNLNTDCRCAFVSTSNLDQVEKVGCPLSPTGFFNMTGENAYFSLIPDASSFIQLPWNKELGWVICNVHHNDRPYPQCPRSALLKAAKEALEKGFTFKCGIEPEFFILDKDSNELADKIDAKQPYPLHEPSGICRNFSLLTELFECVQSLGWKPYQIFHEASSSQYELNFEYDDLITTADRICFFKFMAKQLAEKHGVRITFMPFPSNDILCGTGMHINLSVWDKEGKTNLQKPAPSQKGPSDVTKWMVGGLLKHAKASTALMCSTVNSYKRLVKACWAPNYISWGSNDKTALVRMPNDERIEYRLADAACNPHLVLASIIVCCTEGITQKILPPDGSLGPNILVNKDRILPTALNEALHKFEESEFFRKSLGDSLVEDYVLIKEKDWNEYSKQITEWEKNYYANC